ncbi:transferrin-binding protein-like solute binding protein [Spirabiliibacterium falconis]|uniref:transferrin-binding protein-like solute binding protein n=1 Tax=Spirabiliibacterium falconis TaxID=572023 RepID=UPI001AACE253|nr:transferrin-binding protein-like solute binding protein [Spirabiliibacterium falconis]MBE2894248.1 hypothetical protein [Spirabiliibacterium falconis]
MQTITKTTLAATLLAALTACSSNSTSYELDQPRNSTTASETNPHQAQEGASNSTPDKTDEATEATEPAKPDNSTKPDDSAQPTTPDASDTVTQPKEPKQPVEPTQPAETEPKPDVVNGLEDRTITIPDKPYLGGDEYNPNIQNGVASYYSAGGAHAMSKPGTNNAVQLQLKDVLTDADKKALQNAKIDPNERHVLEVKDKDGTLLGRFQFVNQSYSSYGTFVPEDTQYNYGEKYSYDNLAMFLATPTTEAQFAQQKGTATYSGHTLGYVDGPKGETPTQGYMGDVSLNVNFDTKMIDGKVTARQDGFTKYSPSFTDDNKNPTAEGIELTKSDLILEKTEIKVSKNGTMSFGEGAYNNVAVIKNNGEKIGFNKYSGTFAGPNADEIVGQIGGGEERIAFGASRDK